MKFKYSLAFTMKFSKIFHNDPLEFDEKNNWSIIGFKAPKDWRIIIPMITTKQNENA